jgi:hypothetical protein
MIPPAKPGRSIDGGEKSLDLVSGQEVDHALNMAFPRYREDTLD